MKVKMLIQIAGECSVEASPTAAPMAGGPDVGELVSTTVVAMDPLKVLVDWGPENENGEASKCGPFVVHALLHEAVHQIESRLKGANCVNLNDLKGGEC